MDSGRVIWITGLSGSGKTTLAQLLSQDLSEASEHNVLLDGDTLRNIYGIPQRYDFNGRLKAGMRHAKLCHLIAQQGMTVICSTISLVHEIHQWNRSNNKKYIEVLLRCDDEVRLKRLKKRCGSELNESINMVGQGVRAEWPLQPHIVLSNNRENAIQSVFLQLKKQLMTYSYE